MITDSLVKKKFIHDTLRQGMVDIEKRWRSAVGAFNRRSGALQRFADHPAPTMNITEHRLSVLYDIPLHMRFVDIAEHKKKGRRGEGSRNIYNKVVWPIVYQQVRPELKHGLTDELRRQLRTSLQQALDRKQSSR